MIIKNLQDVTCEAFRSANQTATIQETLLLASRTQHK